MTNSLLKAATLKNPSSDLPQSVQRAVSTDGTQGLPAPTGVGFEAVYQGGALAYFQMNGVIS